MKWLIKVTILLFLVYIFVSLFGCQKGWQKRGIKKGWLDTTTVTAQFHVERDTVRIDSLVESFITELDTLLQDTCINEVTRVKIKYLFKDKFVPQIIKEAFRDTNITVNGVTIKLRNTSNGFDVIVLHKKAEIKAIEKKWYEEEWFWILIVILVTAFILWRITR